MKKILKLLFLILVLVIIMFGIVSFRKIIIINKLNKFAEETNADFKNEFSMKIINSSFEFDNFTTVESVVKNGGAKIIETNLDKETENKIITTTYYLDDKATRIIEMNDNKIYSIEEEKNFPKLNVYKRDIKDVSSIEIQKSKLKYIDVYIISDKEKVYFVNSRNGLILKEIDLLNNVTHEYTYQLGNIKEEIELPDLTGLEYIK